MYKVHLFVCETGYFFRLSPYINLSLKSITRLEACLVELEETSDQPHTCDLANQLLTKLKSLDDFKKFHFDIINQIDDEDTLELLLISTMTISAPLLFIYRP